ncbi:MAG: hypothetical protein SFV54_05550 [Bryobacteraceae bacterium]|nr:hypothetical protein [Bryobacteraceae bacterium]
MIAVALLAAASCEQARRTPTPTGAVPSTRAEAAMSNPYAPQSGDEKLERGSVTIEAVERRASSGRTVITVKGSLPTPCHKLRLRVPSTASPGGVYALEAWSVRDANEMCAQVLHPFSAEVAVEATDAKVTVNGASYE